MQLRDLALEAINIKNKLEEGSCLIFNPTGDRKRLDMVARLNHADLLALPAAQDKPR